MTDYVQVFILCAATVITHFQTLVLSTHTAVIPSENTHLRQKRPMQGLTCLLWNPCMWTHKLGRSPHGSLGSADSGSCLHLCSHGRMDSGPHDTLIDMVNHHRSKHQQRTYVHQTTVNFDLLWQHFIKYALAKINASLQFRYTTEIHT